MFDILKAIVGMAVFEDWKACMIAVYAWPGVDRLEPRSAEISTFL